MNFAKSAWACHWRIISSLDLIDHWRIKSFLLSTGSASVTVAYRLGFQTTHVCSWGNTGDVNKFISGIPKLKHRFWKTFLFSIHSERLSLQLDSWSTNLLRYWGDIRLQSPCFHFLQARQNHMSPKCELKSFFVVWWMFQRLRLVPVTLVLLYATSSPGISKSHWCLFPVTETSFVAKPVVINLEIHGKYLKFWSYQEGSRPESLFRTVFL